MSLFRPETRSTDSGFGVPLSSALAVEMFGAAPSTAGVAVTEQSSLKYPAVWRAVNLIQGVCGSTPLDVLDKDRVVVTGTFLDDPHPDMTPSELWGLSYTHRALWGNFYAQVLRKGTGDVAELYPIHPSRVRVGRVKRTASNPAGKVFEIRPEHVEGDPASDRVLMGTQSRAEGDLEVFHIPGFGYDGLTGVSPIRLASQTIGTGQAADEFAARFFGSGSLLGGVLQTEQRLDPEQAERLKLDWKRKQAGLGNAHEIAVLDGGVKFTAVGIPPDDAQFLESRQFQVEEVARWFGIPPHLLMHMSKSTSWGTGLETQSTNLVVYSLNPGWLTPTEQRISKHLLRPGRRATYRVERMLRGDSAARSQLYATLFNTASISPNEIRAREDMPPRGDEGGDEFYLPLNTGASEATGSPSTPVGSDEPENDEDGSDVEDE